jgi:hypothetical protein
MKNWKTTVAGILTLAVLAANAFGYIDIVTTERLTMALVGLGLWAAKDSNVTGGSTKQ